MTHACARVLCMRFATARHTLISLLTSAIVDLDFLHEEFTVTQLFYINIHAFASKCCCGHHFDSGEHFTSSCVITRTETQQQLIHRPQNEPRHVDGMIHSDDDAT